MAAETKEIKIQTTVTRITTGHGQSDPGIEIVTPLLKEGDVVMVTVTMKEPPYPFCRAKHRAECIKTGRCQSNLKDGYACND